VAARRKAQLTKQTLRTVFEDKDQWKVLYGKLKPGRGRPSRTAHLFRVVGEKLPLEALSQVRFDLKDLGHPHQGVYVAHDSMGCPRYIGRGDIFQRLEARRKAQPLELKYFSFYVVSDKKHEREIETLLINGQVVVRVGGDREGALPDAQQVVFAHHPQHAFVVDVKTVMLQFGRDPPVSIRRPFQGDLLQLIPDIHLDWRHQARRLPTIETGTVQAGHLT
jgi:hypothetical protein